MGCFPRPMGEALVRIHFGPGKRRLKKDFPFSTEPHANFSHPPLADAEDDEKDDARAIEEQMAMESENIS